MTTTTTTRIPARPVLAGLARTATMLTAAENVATLTRIATTHPEWWADPHRRLHARYGWHPVH